MRRLCFKLLLAATLLLASCGYPGVPQPPSLDLPRSVADLRAVRKGNTVYLSWTVPTETTDSLAIRHLGPTRICRSAEQSMSDCSHGVGEMPTLPTGNKPAPKQQQNFTDGLSPISLSDNPSAEISYAVSVLNERGRSAGISNVVKVPAFAAIPAPTGLSAQVTDGGVVLSWTPVPTRPVQDVRLFYRVYRRLEGGSADVVVGEAPADASQVIDQSFDWEKTYLYRITLVTAIDIPEHPKSQFESDDTPPVKVFAHDTFPPGVPSGLQAVYSGAGQQPFIDLLWAPDTEADLAGYNVYRSEQGRPAEKVSLQPVQTASFRDTNVRAGHTYTYSVSAVDIRGNESEHSGEASEKVP